MSFILMLNPHGIDVDLIAGPSHSEAALSSKKSSIATGNQIEIIEFQHDIFKPFNAKYNQHSC